MITLPPDCDLAAATALHSALMEGVESGDPLLIDAAPVERLSTPVMQLLLVARMECEKRGAPFVIEKPSSAFMKACEDFGVVQLLVA